MTCQDYGHAIMNCNVMWSCEKIQRLQRLHFVSKMAM
nr:MAG TPA: hypothetical protein [Caudoviricetes sp.]